MRTRDGQALLEFCLAVLIIAPGVFAAASFVHDRWLRVKCMHLAFERAHLSLLRAEPRQGIKTPIKGEAWCGKIPEKVEFRRLEDLRAR